MSEISGWIKLHRSIQDHWIYPDGEFTKYEAWIDLLMMVNHKDGKVIIGKDLVEVKRGQRITSIRKLCSRWGWSNTKVKAFLKLLEDDGMITVKNDTKKTLITIVNYGFYQDDETQKTTDKRHKNDTETTQKHTNKNDKNDKEDIPYFEIVNYLNQKTNSRYKHTTRRTRDFIKARWNEGFNVDDFKRVIDIKSSEWLDNPKMSKFLRPQTLFGTKFESYLNQPEVTEPVDLEEQRLKKQQEYIDRKIAMQRWVEAGNDIRDFVFRGLGS